jgi:hypothetical protein
MRGEDLWIPWSLPERRCSEADTAGHEETAAEVRLTPPRLTILRLKDRRRESAPSQSCLQGVTEKHRDCQRTDSAGNRSNRGHFRKDPIEVDVADEHALAGGQRLPDACGASKIFGSRIQRLEPVDSHVDDNGALAYELRGHETRPPDGGHQDVRFPAELPQTSRFGVGERDRGVAAREQRGDGLAYDLAAPENDGPCAGEGYLIVIEQREDSSRRTGNEARPPLVKPPDVVGVESIYVLERVERIEDLSGVVAWLQRHLHEDAVH